ncbi:hypothetical protein [Flavobacterium sp. HBTb2-11-1]|uniref:hypothetical protein n=1 Tax=Flavobacterium sp. HBTb2-11-1 TaxID=2692212 RepID=UPI00136C991B|nr:hypothetical protein [Flavobacterium sp. HBTb2-11-1]MXO05711.1 hypothetical protein [Flavobacterium sp. HBTb2-11-1]
MRNILKRFLFCLILLIQFTSYAQGEESICPVFALANDLSTANAEFKTSIKDPEIFNAWNLLSKESSALRTNIEELKLVSKNLDEINTVGGYLKWKGIQGTTTTIFNDFKRRIDFGGDIIKTSGKKLNILGRVGPKNETMGTMQLFNELKLKGVPENEMSGLFQPIPKEWASLSVMEQNTKYWNEINKIHIDNVILNKGDIRFIHDPRLAVNQWNIVADMPENAFKEKCIKEGLVKLKTYMKMEYDYLLSKGYILQETGLMIKP